jgi:hypothetical protein
MSRISIYVPQTTAPGLPAPEIAPIDGSRGLLGGLKSIIETIDAKNQREAAARAGAAAESGNPTDPSSDEVQQPVTRKDGVAGPTDPNDRAVNAIDAKEKQDASAYSANALAKLAESGLNLAQLSADTAAGHTLDINNQFEKGLNEALAGAPNDVARQMIVRQMPRVQGDIHRAALNAEAFANIAKRNADATETLEIYGRLVQADPSQVQLRMDEAAALGRSLLMSSIERKAFEAKRLELPRIALASLIDRNAAGAVLEMKQGRWSQYIDSETLTRMQTMAEQQITLGQQNADAESEFNSEHLRLDLSKFGKMLLDGHAISGANPLNSPERFTDVLDDNVAKFASNTLAAQREIGTFFATAQTLGHQGIDAATNAVKAAAPPGAGQRDDLPSHLMPSEILTSTLERPMIARERNKFQQGGWFDNFRWPWQSSPSSDSETTAPDEDTDWYGDFGATADGPELVRFPDPRYGKIVGNTGRIAPLPPRTILDTNVPDEFQPNAWRSQYQPKSHLGKTLLDPRDLSARQRTNLYGRRWASPTETGPTLARLRDGYGYFGARRSDGTYHAGIDFPGNEVRMPTRARFVGWRWDARNGYTLVFDLGDGLQLSLLHVTPTAELRERGPNLDSAEDIRTFRRRGPGLVSQDFELGDYLGTVDHAKADHVHMQIICAGGTLNGERLERGFAADPTPLFPT